MLSPVNCQSRSATAVPGNVKIIPGDWPSNAASRLTHESKLKPVLQFSSSASIRAVYGLPGQYPDLSRRLF